MADPPRRWIDACTGQAGLRAQVWPNPPDARADDVRAVDGEMVMGSDKAIQPGTLIYRRTDVRAWLFKLNRRYRDAMRAAEAEGNEEWRFNAVQKLRLISEMREMIDTDCPVFACPGVAD